MAGHRGRGGRDPRAAGHAAADAAADRLADPGGDGRGPALRRATVPHGSPPGKLYAVGLGTVGLCISAAAAPPRSSFAGLCDLAGSSWRRPWSAGLLPRLRPAAMPTILLQHLVQLDRTRFPRLQAFWAATAAALAAGLGCTVLPWRDKACPVRLVRSTGRLPRRADARRGHDPDGRQNRGVWRSRWQYAALAAGGC